MQEQNIQNRNRFANSNRWTGLLFLVVGGVLLMKQTGYPFPAWLFTWPVVLMLFGLFMGVRHRFRDLSWLVMVTIGFVFLSDDIWPGVHLKQYAIPIVIIMLGVLFIFSPRRMCGGPGRFRRHMANRPGFQQPEFTNEPVLKEVDATQDTALDVVSIFAGVKKRVLSKQFTGGDIVCVFGGAEINLTNADFISPVVLDLTMVFGGTKLIIPANWELRSEIAAIFGGVDDKRPQPAVGIPEKTIILKGTLMFGGVEVNSFQQ
jgi:predicted membrane protein